MNDEIRLCIDECPEKKDSFICCSSCQDAKTCENACDLMDIDCKLRGESKNDI